MSVEGGLQGRDLGQYHGWNELPVRADAGLRQGGEIATDGTDMEEAECAGPVRDDVQG